MSRANMSASGNFSFQSWATNTIPLAYAADHIFKYYPETKQIYVVNGNKPIPARITQIEPALPKEGTSEWYEQDLTVPASIRVCLYLRSVHQELSKHWQGISIRNSRWMHAFIQREQAFEEFRKEFAALTQEEHTEFMSILDRIDANGR